MIIKQSYMTNPFFVLNNNNNNNISGKAFLSLFKVYLDTLR